MSYSLQPHELQHARCPCPSLFPQVCSNSCPLSWWYHPTISSPVTPFLLLPSIFSRIKVSSKESPLHIRWPKYWIFSFSISVSNEYFVLISFRIGWFDLLLSKGLSRVFFSTNSKASVLWCSAFFMVQNNRDSSIWEAIFSSAQTYRYSPGPGITGAAKNKIKSFYKPSVQKFLLKGSTFTTPHFQVRRTMT